MTDIRRELEKMCKGIVDELNAVYTSEDSEDLWEWAESALDIEYRIGYDKEYRSVEICVACGGPNIYVDTQTSDVRGYWGGEKVEEHLPYELRDMLDDIFSELYNC